MAKFSGANCRAAACPDYRRFSQGARIGVTMASLLVAGPLLAQEASYTATTTIFTDLTHTSTDRDNDTRGGVGIRGDVGALLQSGAHNFNARYGALMESERSSLARNEDDDLSFYGSSRYDFYRPGGRFDANAGHTIRSVRNATGFALDPAQYSTQNALSAGAGVSFYPGALTSLRLGGQAGKTWEEDRLEDGESASVDAALTRRFSERTNLSLNGSRSWEERGDTSLTLDNATVGTDTRFENGSLSMQAGVSRAQDDDFENDAVIGSLVRTWVSERSDTQLSFDRTQTSTLLDLTFAPIPDFGLDNEFSIRLQGLTLRNSVGLTHNNRNFCSLCTVRFIARGTEREDVQTEVTDYEYLLGTGISIAMDTLQTLDFDYRWQGDAFTDRTTIDDEVHRFYVTGRRQLTELATFGASVGADITRGTDDRERYIARLFFTLGWAGAESAW